jgi:bacterioferritin
MERKKTIELLNLDLQDEHGAIIQYLGQAYALGEGATACEIEAIAREEMRHFDWLAETIADLGGAPSLKRGTMRPGGDSAPDWMDNDIFLERLAIENYKEHSVIVADARIRRLLQRIQADEEAHRAKFESLVEKTRHEGTTDLRGGRQDGITRTLNWGIAQEYTVVLQYLFHAYISKSPEAKKQLEDQAINEMQHMGWLAEELVRSGGSPAMEPARTDQSTRTADMLRADIKTEREVAEAYDRAARMVEDPRLKALLLRIRDNEKYHLDIFTELLKKEER